MINAPTEPTAAALRVHPLLVLGALRREVPGLPADEARRELEPCRRRLALAEAVPGAPAVVADVLVAFHEAALAHVVAYFAAVEAFLVVLNGTVHAGTFVY